MIQKRPACRQAGIAHIFLILFLLAGLAVGVYLVQQKTNILPKAAEQVPPQPPHPLLPRDCKGPYAGDCAWVRSSFDRACLPPRPECKDWFSLGPIVVGHECCSPGTLKTKEQCLEELPGLWEWVNVEGRSECILTEGRPNSTGGCTRKIATILVPDPEDVDPEKDCLDRNTYDTNTSQ